MAGELLGESVVISDMAEGSQVYNKGYYGYPRPGGGLELDLLEALYLVECDKLQVFQNGKLMDHASLYRRVARSAEDLQSRYLVYRDLRQRGYIVKLDQGDFHFRVYQRGRPRTGFSRYRKGTSSTSRRSWRRARPRSAPARTSCSGWWTKRGTSPITPWRGRSRTA
jgi:tRNA splicing endonuclease